MSYHNGHQGRYIPRFCWVKPQGSCWFPQYQKVLPKHIGMFLLANWKQDTDIINNKPLDMTIFQSNTINLCTCYSSVSVAVMNHWQKTTWEEIMYLSWQGLSSRQGLESEAETIVECFLLVCFFWLAQWFFFYRSEHLWITLSIVCWSLPHQFLLCKYPTDIPRGQSKRRFIHQLRFFLLSVL